MNTSTTAAPRRAITPTLRLETLEARETPSVAAQRYAVGAAAGDVGTVNVYAGGTNALVGTLTPFGTNYTGGVRVATGDLTGDGVDDLVAATGTGRAQVKVIDGATGATVADFFAFSETSRHGSYVAVGDVTGDGRKDLVVGTGEGGRPQVKVFRGQELTQKAPQVAANLVPFDPNFRGGVRVAVGDLNGDRIGDIIAAPGAGIGPDVKIYTPKTAWGDNRLSLRFTESTVRVGGAGDTGGVFVAAGDFDGNGRDDLVVGRSVNGRARVSVFDGAYANRRLLDASGFNATAPGGVPVAVHNLGGDRRAEIVAGGGGGVSQVRVIGQQGGLNASFLAFGNTYRNGVFVG